MSKKTKISSSDEEQIIEFVKNNDMLYNAQHPDFRNTQAKYRLWSELANNLNTEVDAVRRKWGTMRDYFVRNQSKKSSGKPAPDTKRDELMMFLLDTPTLKRTIKNQPPELSTSKEENVDLIVKNELDPSESGLMFESYEDLPHDFTMNEALESRINECSDNLSSSTAGIETDGHSTGVNFEMPLYNNSRKRSAPSPDQSDALYKILASRQPHLVNFMPPTLKPKDHLHYFFESLASTMRTFPNLSVAKLKLKMSQLVGEEEVSLARQAQLTPNLIMTE